MSVETTELYPEHEKLLLVKQESQAIGEFLDFSGYTLCTLVEEGNNGEPRFLDSEGKPTHKGGFNTEWNPAFESWNDHYAPVYESIEKVLARYFNVNLELIEQEKRAMLSAQRRLNEQANA